MEGPAKLFKSLWVFLKDIFEYNVAAEGSVMVLELLPCFQIAGLCEFGHCVRYFFGAALVCLKGKMNFRRAKISVLFRSVQAGMTIVGEGKLGKVWMTRKREKDK